MLSGPVGAEVFAAGVAVSDAKAAVVLLHGRGGTARGMLDLVTAFGTRDVAYLAPQAPRLSWYPYGFMAPLEENEPELGAALDLVDRLLGKLEEDGLEPPSLALLGFSQGACLALEYGVRHPRRYGALIGLSGGLIGPEGTEWNHPGSFDNTPVFLGCSDVDPHIPVERVHETADVLSARGARVTQRLYPGMGHTVNEDELEQVKELLANLQKPGSRG